VLSWEDHGDKDRRLDPGQAIAKALAKIEAILPKEYMEDIRQARDRILFDVAPFFGTGEHPSLEALKAAVVHNWRLRIRYPSHCQLVPSERTVDLPPIGWIL
jgi:hypothetical protein